MSRLTLAITLSGLWRFTTEAIESLHQCVVVPLQREHDVRVFIHAWADRAPPRDEVAFVESRLPVSELQFEPLGVLAGSAFDGSVHPHRDRYKSQWEGVACACDLVIRCVKPCAILRTRMDLVYLTPLRLPRIAKANEIYIPPVEGHYDTPFDPSIVNDQMAFGSLPVMQKYMTLARRRTASQWSVIENRSRHQASRDHRLGELKGVEGPLRECLLDEGISVRRLDVFYRLQRQAEAPKQRFCATVPIWMYGRAPNRWSPWLINRSFPVWNCIRALGNKATAATNV